MFSVELIKRYNTGERDFNGANLRGAYLSGADLRGANLSGADLSRAYLSGANLSEANLSRANLSEANLSRAYLSGADLRGADLSGAYLSGANLRGAYLSGADLSGADLRGVDLRGADLRGADLSGAIGLQNASDYLAANFESATDGIIAYKTFGAEYDPPAHWIIKPGSVLTETVNPDRCTDCGSGVNVAPLSWVRNRYPGHTVWRVLIRWMDLADAVVPFGTDGKIRAGRVTLLEKVD